MRLSLIFVVLAFAFPTTSIAEEMTDDRLGEIVRSLGLEPGYVSTRALPNGWRIHRISGEAWTGEKERRSPGGSYAHLSVTVLAGPGAVFSDYEEMIAAVKETPRNVDAGFGDWARADLTTYEPGIDKERNVFAKAGAELSVIGRTVSAKVLVQTFSPVLGRFGDVPDAQVEAESAKMAEASRERAVDLGRRAYAALSGEPPTADLREIVRRILKGGTMVADVPGDMPSEADRIAADLERIVRASRDEAAALAGILVEFLKDQELGRSVHPLLTGRLTGFRQAMKLGDRVVLENLRKGLPADHYLIRYARSLDRLEEKDRRELLRDLHRLADTTSAFLLAALDLGSMLAGFPGPSAVLSQTDLWQKLTSPNAEVRKGALSPEEIPKQVLNALGALPSPSDVSWLQAGWTLVSAWAGQSSNMPEAFPSIDPDIQAALDAGRAESEFVWFERMNAALTGLSYEFRRTTVLLAQIDKYLKDRGWTRARPGGMPDELREFVVVGNHIEGWLKPAAAQIVATGYYSGWSFAKPTAEPR